MADTILIVTDGLLEPASPPTAAALRLHSIASGLRQHGFTVRWSVPKAQLPADAPVELAEAAHLAGAVGEAVAATGARVVLLDGPERLGRVGPLEVPLVVDLALTTRPTLTADHAGRVAGFLVADRVPRPAVREALADVGVDPLARAIWCPFCAPRDEPPARARAAEPSLLCWGEGELVEAAPVARMLAELDTRGAGGVELLGASWGLPGHPRLKMVEPTTYGALLERLGGCWVGLALEPGRGAVQRALTLAWAGVPLVVGADHPLVQEVMQVGAGWVVASDDEGALAATLGPLMRQAERFDEASQAARALAELHGATPATLPLAEVARAPERAPRPVPEVPEADSNSTWAGSGASGIGPGVGAPEVVDETLEQLADQQADIAQALSEAQKTLEQQLDHQTVSALQARAELRRELSEKLDRIEAQVTEMAEGQSRSGVDAGVLAAAVAGSVVERLGSQLDASERIAAMREAIEARLEKLETVHARAEAAEEERLALTSSLSERNGELGELRARLAERDEALARLRGEVDEARGRTAHFEEQVRRLTGELDGARRRIGELEAQPPSGGGLSRNQELVLVFAMFCFAVLTIVGPRGLVVGAERAVGLATGSPWLAALGVVGLGLLGLALLYRARHRLPIPFRWTWLTPTRARWLGAIKLLALYAVSLFVFAYLKVWERLTGRRSAA